MGSLRVMTLAGAAAILMSGAASAADMPAIMAPAPVAAPVEQFAGGWYLRGDIGIGSNSFGEFDHHQTNQAFVWPTSWRIENKGIQDTVFFGIGIGYQFNSWFRVDATAEYRTAAKFNALGSYTQFCTDFGGNPAAKCFDQYNGSHHAGVFLANAYFDLGTWYRITPFLGAGIGGAYHRIAGFGDVNTTNGGFGYANDHSEWKTAWALHAGLAYNVSSNFKVELAYRYLNMGTVATGVVDCQGCGIVGGPLAYYSLNSLQSHDFKLGVRWLLDEPAPVYMPAPAPLVRKG